MEKQVKSKQRVADHGEVFTAEREVKAMCDLVADECNRIDSRFLEPACGDGNFLAEIISRKLAVVDKRYKKSPYDWERNSLLALGSIYGVDILQDNVFECRKRLFAIWQKAYRKSCRKDCNEDTEKTAKYILSKGIICGNALTYHYVDADGNDTSSPIIFCEWSFPSNNAFIHCKEYIFEQLVNGTEQKEEKEMTLFDNDEDEGLLVGQYVVHYRRLWENE